MGLKTGAIWARMQFEARDLDRFERHRSMNVSGSRLHVSPPQGLCLADCDFYHSMSIPGVGEIVGLWDLRETVDDYLGRIDFAGKRVLEIGPASGFLTIEMERRGADVVAVELPDGVGWDFVPFPEAFLAPIREKQIAGMPRLKNSFWFTHAANKSKGGADSRGHL